MPRCLYLWANKFFTYRAGVVGEKISPSGTHAILETPLLFLPDIEYPFICQRKLNIEAKTIIPPNRKRKNCCATFATQCVALSFTSHSERTRSD